MKFVITNGLAASVTENKEESVSVMLKVLKEYGLPDDYAAEAVGLLTLNGGEDLPELVGYCNEIESEYSGNLVD